MLGIVQIINGIKQIVPLASGNNDAPLGSVMAYYGTTDPSDKNWLICDGRDTTGTDIELETHYPSFYVFNGRSNVLPDLRECALVGVGQNGTDTIATHDTYTLGQFKDDQFQDHIHQNYGGWGSGSTDQGRFRVDGNSPANAWNERSVRSGSGYRYGTTTHGKQKGVNWIMKVTSTSDSYHLPTQEILQVEQYFDEGLSKAESYSTTEQLTGGTWIDGKPIYRCVMTGLSFGGQANAWSTITGTDAIRNVIDTLIRAEPRRSSDNSFSGTFNIRKGTQKLEYYIYSTFTGCDQLILEYTKTS